MEGEKEEEGVYRREEKTGGGKSSSLEVALVLQSLLSPCRLEEGRGKRALAKKKPWSLILIKKHKEHQRPTPNLYQSGAPTIPVILKLPGAIQCQVLKQAQRLGWLRGWGTLRSWRSMEKFVLTFFSPQWLAAAESLFAGRKKKVGADDNWQLLVDNGN